MGVSLDALGKSTSLKQSTANFRRVRHLDKERAQTMYDPKMLTWWLQVLSPSETTRFPF